MQPDTGFFAGTSDELKRLIATLAREVTLASGEELFAEGDEGDALYVVVDGAIEISVLSRGGRKLALDVLRAGALFGEIALFDPGLRTATATALEPSRLMRLRNGDLLREIAARPEVAIDLIRLAGLRMRWMSRQLRDQVFLPLPARLARKILHLCPAPAAGGARLALSQSELAEFAGATREAVSRILIAWKAQGLVEPQRGGLVILDQPALAAIAGLPAPV